MGGMTRKGPVDLSSMDRGFFEELSPEARVELLCRLHALAIEQAEKLARDSTNSSRPPSSDGPFGPASGSPTGTVPPPNPPPASAPATAPEPPSRSGRKPGKQRGTKGIWRCEPLQAERDENHYPTLCAACATPFEMWDRQRAATAPTSCSTWSAQPAASGSPACGTAIMPSSVPAVFRPPPGPASVCSPRCRDARAICC